MSPNSLFVLSEDNKPISYTYTREKAQRAILKLATVKVGSLKTKWIDSWIHSLDEANTVEVRCRKLGLVSWTNGSEYTVHTYKIAEVESFKEEDVFDELMDRVKEAERILQESIKEDEEDITAKSKRIIADAEKLIKEGEKALKQ